MNHLEKYIREHRNWRELLLKPPYDLMIKRDENYPDLYLFKYSITSDMSLPLVQEARGVILEVKDNMDTLLDDVKYVSRPFRKFFNHGEPYAARLDEDYTQWQITEKMDGSMIQVYFYNDIMMVASSGTIDAYEAAINGRSISFGQLFRNYFYHDCFDGIDNLKIQLDHDCTYLFELVSDENQVIIDYKYEDRGIYLLDVMYNKNGQHADQQYKEAARVFRTPKSYSFNTIDEIINFVNTMDATHEGVVVKDKFGERLKIKTPAYFEMHRAYNNGNVGRKRLVPMILDNTIDDFYGLFPQKFDKIKKVEIDFFTMYHAMQEEAKEMIQYYSLPRAEFAKKVLESDLYFKDLQFKLYNGGSCCEYVHKMHLSNILDAIKHFCGEEI